MSKANCSLFVDGNGKYCCRDKVFKIGKNKPPVTVTLANTGPVDLLVYPTGDTDEVFVVHSTLAEGSTTIVDAGTYRLDLDCEALDGTDAPAEVPAQMSACCLPIDMASAADAFLCACIADALAGPADNNAEILIAIQACLAQIKLLIAANNNVTILTDIETELMAICEKMLASGESLEAICKKLETGFTDMVECLKAIKENTACLPDIKVLLECLPDIKALLDCPEGYGDQCFFNTYATADYNVDAVLIGTDDISAKVGAPFDGNNAAAHNTFKEALTACLRDDYGYDVAFTQGRDGFQLKYFGAPVNLTTT